MANWIVTTVTVTGSTFVDQCDTHEQAQEIFETQKRSFNSAYVQVTYEAGGCITQQWIARYFGAAFEVDA